MDISMTAEEKEQLDAEVAKAGRGEDATPAPANIKHEDEKPTVVPTPSSATTPATAPTQEKLATGTEIGTAESPSSIAKEKEKEKEKNRLTAEQKAQLAALDEQRHKEREERVRDLAKKLVDRCRPFETATKPGDLSGAHDFDVSFTGFG